jgi:hypothetical protein
MTLENLERRKEEARIYIKFEQYFANKNKNTYTLNYFSQFSNRVFFKLNSTPSD